MAKKSTGATPKSGPTPKEIVAAWEETFVSQLNPWTVIKGTGFSQIKANLEKNITDLLSAGHIFTTADMRNSLRVAKDVAKICKILQPVPHTKKVKPDTLQLVLLLCAQHHQVCKGPTGIGGGGGWCDA